MYTPGDYTRDAEAKRPYLEKAAQSLPDNDAVEVKSFYPHYDTLADKGETVSIGFKFTHLDRLWKTKQPSHTFSRQYAPGDPGTESLFEEIAKPGQGTFDDPIVYNNNMALEETLYYTQYDVKYYCWRSTGVPVYNDLSALVGIYVQVATEPVENN